MLKKKKKTESQIASLTASAQSKKTIKPTFNQTYQKKKILPSTGNFFKFVNYKAVQQFIIIAKK